MEGLTAFLAWTENSVLAQTINRSPWLYPAIETAHILGFAVLIGSATMFDLRLLGASRALSVRGMARHLLPWARRGFVVAAGAGVLLLASDATRVGTSPVLYAKLGLIGLAGLNMGVFHARVFRSVAD